MKQWKVPLFCFLKLVVSSGFCSSEDCFWCKPLDWHFRVDLAQWGHSWWVRRTSCSSSCWGIWFLPSGNLLPHPATSGTVCPLCAFVRQSCMAPLYLLGVHDRWREVPPERVFTTSTSSDASGKHPRPPKRSEKALTVSLRATLS